MGNQAPSGLAPPSCGQLGGQPGFLSAGCCSSLQKGPGRDRRMAVRKQQLRRPPNKSHTACRKERKSTLTSYENTPAACLHHEPGADRFSCCHWSVWLCSWAGGSPRFPGRRFLRQPIFLPCPLVAIQARTQSKRFILSHRAESCFGDGGSAEWVLWQPG